MGKNKKNTKNTVKTGRKRFATVTGSAAAVVLSAAIVVTSVWHDSIEAQAADTLLGIEKLRDQVQLRGKDYTILEIVPDKSAAEIGFWVDGYEPILGTWDKEGNWLSWKDRLVSYLTPEERKEFVERKKSELLAYYSSKYASTDKQWEKDFPVYGVEGEYEESDKPGDGFEEVTGSNISKTGYFVWNGDSDNSGNGEKYQVAFELVGKNVNNSGVPQDVVYYEVDKATSINDGEIYKDLPDDVWVYQKRRPASTTGSEDYYEAHLWGLLRDKYKPASVSDDQDSDDDSDDDDDDDDKGSDGDNKGGDDGDDKEGGDEDGDESGNEGGGDEDGDESGSEGGGDEDGDEGGSEGGGDSGDEGGSEGSGDSGDDGDGDSTGGNDSDKGESGSGGNSGSDDNGSADLSVRSSASQGRWIKMVSENKDQEADDDTRKLALPFAV